MKKNFVDWSKVSTFISTVAAIVVVLFTYLQLREFNNSIKADFAHRFKIDFFTEKSNNLMTLFDYHLLRFDLVKDENHPSGFGYFSIDTLRIKGLKDKFPALFTQTNYTSYEIDHYMLNHFNDLGQFYKGGVIDISYVYNGFDYYVKSIYENEQIKKYIAWVRSDASSKDSFEGFELIYHELDKYRRTAHH